MALRDIREMVSGDLDACHPHWFRAGQLNFEISCSCSLIHAHVDAVEQEGLNAIASKQLMQATPSEARSGSLPCEEEEESDNEDASQGKTDFLRKAGSIGALEVPPMPPSDPTIMTSQQPSPLPHPCVASPLSLSATPHIMERSPPVQAPTRIPSELHEIPRQGGRSGGDQVSNSMITHAGAEATTTDEPQEIGNEDAHAADGPPEALEIERDRATQDMDVDQSNSGDEGCNVAKGRGTSLRRSDRKRKTPPPPPPEREGTSRGKPASRKKVKSKEQPLKPAPKPAPGIKSNLHTDVGSIERSYFEEIEIGGTTRLVDMVDLTQDMVSICQHIRIRSTEFARRWSPPSQICQPLERYTQLSVFVKHIAQIYMQQRFSGKSVELWAPGKDDPVTYIPSFHVSLLTRARYPLLTSGSTIVQERACYVRRDSSGCYNRLQGWRTLVDGKSS